MLGLYVTPDERGIQASRYLMEQVQTQHMSEACATLEGVPSLEEWRKAFMAVVQGVSPTQVVTPLVESLVLRWEATATTQLTMVIHPYDARLLFSMILGVTGLSNEERAEVARLYRMLTLTVPGGHDMMTIDPT